VIHTIKRFGQITKDSTNHFFIIQCLQDVTDQIKSLVVLQVNCLALEDKPIQQVTELGDGRFFHSLLSIM
jgi:hypothetical protein